MREAPARGRVSRLGLSTWNGVWWCQVLELETGAVRQMYGRRIVANHKIAAGQPKHLYLSSLPLAGVWNEAALVASREVIVCRR
ncbi:hypothetical protein PWP93_27035 [Paraburkholderia sp. A1RI-2L]|uniref:hypothetical protein n=1 Tax=Paraburkholderia sp. A1RI-2L TaxID=3028367 RepID=UPI003B77CC72